MTKAANAGDGLLTGPKPEPVNVKRSTLPDHAKESAPGHLGFGAGDEYRRELSVWR